MGRIYLGKLLLHWCDACHVPVMAARCACGSATRTVSLTPPGDARPAFTADITHINQIYARHFGTPLIPDGHLVVLNKVPSTDRMDEIIMGGAVVGAVRYLPETGMWEPVIRPAAFSYMRPEKRFVVISDDAAPFIRDGASVLAPGLVHIDDAVEKDDDVFVLSESGECIATGRAKVGAADAREMERGVIVRTRKNPAHPCVPGEATRDAAVLANEKVISQYEKSAISFVKDVVRRHPHLPATVSYSGGKDSLATLLIVLKAIGEVPLIFVDTGLEFPETCENVALVSGHYGLDVMAISSKEQFWDEFRKNGPPAVDARWCCAACKLNPVKRLIEERWGECLSFIGQRKYESVRRMASPRVWRNSRVRNQLSAAPIQHWTAMHVWLYLFRENAPYNVLYEEQMDRIGCFMCPSSDRGIMKIIESRRPALWNAWTRHLEDWRERHGLPAEWITEALWRRRGDEPEEDSYN